MMFLIDDWTSHVATNQRRKFGFDQARTVSRTVTGFTRLLREQFSIRLSPGSDWNAGADDEIRTAPGEYDFLWLVSSIVETSRR
jgi:hypothetical protein